MKCSVPRGGPAPPTDESELESRAARLAGLTLGELAHHLGAEVPPDLRRAKGWVGALMERALGASAASRAEPDFPHLGIELKTLPVDRTGRPVESTFVCTIDLQRIADHEWEASRLWKKLSRVLWIPVLGERSVRPGERSIGQALLWTPTPAQSAQLRADWELLAEFISQGRTREITGHLGQVVQVRPKAARGSSRRRAFDESGGYYDEQPKGFYLRPSFTASLLAEAFILPAPDH